MNIQIGQSIPYTSTRHEAKTAELLPKWHYRRLEIGENDGSSSLFVFVAIDMEKISQKARQEPYRAYYRKKQFWESSPLSLSQLLPSVIHHISQWEKTHAEKNNSKIIIGCFRQPMKIFMFF